MPVVVQMLDVAPCTGEEIVGADHVCILREQPLAQMRAEKAGPSGNQHACFQVHPCMLLRAPRAASFEARSLRSLTPQDDGHGRRGERFTAC
jgi:hypothetical protein